MNMPHPPYLFLKQVIKSFFIRAEKFNLKIFPKFATASAFTIVLFRTINAFMKSFAKISELQLTESLVEHKREARLFIRRFSFQ